MARTTKEINLRDTNRKKRNPSIQHDYILRRPQFPPENLDSINILKSSRIQNHEKLPISTGSLLQFD